MDTIACNLLVYLSTMFNVIALPAFSDNYIWLIHDQHHAIVVDPGNASPVVQAIDQRGLKLLAVLNTHHHSDHVDGNSELHARYGCPVYGPRTEFIPQMTHPLVGGMSITFPELDLNFNIINTPGHTLGHIAYYGSGYLFCGDTLFGCGCGRLFEGTPAQMHDTLSKLRQLPDHTLICCAHEYTISNIRFAQTVDNENPDLLRREQHDLLKRNQGLPTLPSSLRLEKLTNPFLRVDQTALYKAAEGLSGRKPDNDIDVFSIIRKAKDTYRG